jgi:hypothetical protein
MQAWRGKERIMAAVNGTLEDGYRLLPAYCEQVFKTNPGSVATYRGTGPGNAHPFIDKADLKGKYLGTLLCASAVDADHMMFSRFLILLHHGMDSCT